jgi:hypothetical protein
MFKILKSGTLMNYTEILMPINLRADDGKCSTTLDPIVAPKPTIILEIRHFIIPIAFYADQSTLIKNPPDDLKFTTMGNS